MRLRHQIIEGDFSLKLGMALFFLMLVLFLQGQPAGYYDSASGLTGKSLQQALHDIIDDNTTLSYSSLWTYFASTDKKADGKVWDMYSDVPGGTPAYTFTFGTNQCGNYSKEGDCYNREHSFPNSWFGGEVYPMYSDLFHLYPTDGYVNNKRGSYPFGTTSNATWTSTNGSKVGTCSYPGFSGTIFEPVNGYKGDFARTCFYMAVRYFGEDTGWPGSDMVNGSQLKPWALSMLLQWDQSDPVSQKEKDRNEAVYLIQGNRNPFIDNPAYANLIWGTQSSIQKHLRISQMKVWPNPAKDNIRIELPESISDGFELKVLDISGKTVICRSGAGQSLNLDCSDMASGFYIIVVSSSIGNLYAPVVISN